MQITTIGLDIAIRSFPFQFMATGGPLRRWGMLSFPYPDRIRLGYDDVARADRALKGIVGKRLTYRTPHI